MNWNEGGVTEREPSLDRDGRAAYRVESIEFEPSTAVVSAVAEVTDSDLLDDGTVLYDVVDPDALDRLFGDRENGAAQTVGKVVFDLRGCRVEVRSDGELIVFEPTKGSTQSCSSPASSV